VPASPAVAPTPVRAGDPGGTASDESGGGASSGNSMSKWAEPLMRPEK